MATLRGDQKLMRDVPVEPQAASAIAQYVDNLPEERSFMEKLKGNSGLNATDPQSQPLILNFVQAIQTGQLDDARVQKLIKRNPGAASVFASALDDYKRASAQQGQVKGIYSKYFQPGEQLPADQAGPARPPTSDYQGAITDFYSRGMPDEAKKLVDTQKAMKEGGGKGMYGGIRTGIIPGTNKLIEYGIDETTGQAREVGTNKVLTRGKDYEPTVGQTIMPVLGGGLQSFPNRAGVGSTLPSAPTGQSAMPSEAETVKTGQAINANSMAQRMYDLVNTGKVEVGPVSGRKLSFATVTGAGLTPEDAEFASLEENYSNALLQAMRGAQVGPKEQEMFNKSLPQRNQPKEVLLSNIKTTTDNINRLNAVESRLRAVPALTSKEKIDTSGKPEEWIRVNGRLQRKQ